MEKEEGWELYKNENRKQISIQGQGKEPSQSLFHKFGAFSEWEREEEGKGKFGKRRGVRII